MTKAVAAAELTLDAEMALISTRHSDSPQFLVISTQLGIEEDVLTL